MENIYLYPVETGTVVVAAVKEAGVVIGLLESQGETIVENEIRYFYDILVSHSMPVVRVYRDKLSLIKRYITESEKEEERKKQETQDKQDSQDKHDDSGMTAIDRFYKSQHKEGLYGSR